MESAAFHAHVAQARQRRSGPAAVEEWLTAGGVQPEDVKPTRKTAAAGAAGLSVRNDVQTSASAAGDGITLWPVLDTNIYKYLEFHDQAAASLAAFSQARSGFTADMGMEDGEAVTRFRAYLNEMATAPHWLLTSSKEQTVSHNMANHAAFVVNLVNIVVAALEGVGADGLALESAASAVKELATGLSTNVSRE
ncbi:hypothetical protein L7F22_010304 [Adiantum nelumboides]|nr:hypothetical protein [Adiantum nelumboides]